MGQPDKLQRRGCRNSTQDKREGTWIQRQPEGFSSGNIDDARQAEGDCAPYGQRDSR